MTKKFTVLFMMAILTVALAAAGCGKKEATTEGSTAAGTETSTAATTAAPESGAASTAAAPDTTKH